jgi:hypothetical protein
METEEGMRPYPRILSATIWGLAAFGAVHIPASAETNPGAVGVAPQPSAFDSADQNSPETLNGRLAYAEHLTEAADGDCQQRVGAAQRQLNAVVAKPAFFVVMPFGTAREANVEYSIHSMLASCSAEAAMQQNELRAAREAALHAAEFYRDGFDYQSMAVMQFDAAVADRQLGDRAGAAAMLRSAIDMDEEYGLQKDAQDNEALLLQWMDDGSSRSHVAELTRIVPNRSAILKFAWPVTDADVTIAASYVAVIDGKIVRSQGAAKRALSIRHDGVGWVMSFPANNRKFDFNGWPQGHAQEEVATLLLANVRLASPGIRVDSTGEFKSAVDPSKISARLADETVQMTRYIVLKRDSKLDAMPKVAKAVKYVSAPDQIEAIAAEDYGLTTGAWIGATLHQGVWYNMTAPLRAPGTAYVIDHDIQFAYTRSVPCTTSSTVSSCVEIVLHATPNPVALGKWADYMEPELGLPQGQSAHYWSATDIRIVTDPNNLLAYVSDVQRYWYLSAEGAKNNVVPVISSERIVSTTNYH